MERIAGGEELDDDDDMPHTHTSHPQSLRRRCTGLTF